MLRFSKRGKFSLLSFCLLVIILTVSTGSIQNALELLFQDFSHVAGVKDYRANDQKDSEYARVIDVIDGDTIVIDGGRKVRYIGIDTPESVDPKRATECFGKEAAAYNKELVLGKEVKLEKDVSETDRYGRLLRYVYSGCVMVNELLVKEGYAYAVSYPPDVKYQERLRGVEREAREQQKGLWSACSDS